MLVVRGKGCGLSICIMTVLYIPQPKLLNYALQFLQSILLRRQYGYVRVCTCITRPVGWSGDGGGSGNNEGGTN